MLNEWVPRELIPLWLYLTSVCISSEIGVALAGFGTLFLFLGVILLFDKGLLAIGNVSLQALKN